MTLPDHDARVRAMTAFADNLVVTAGAGTGKTSLLVGRLLAALVAQHLEPQQILAVTFTENAAAEMQERLLRVLRAVAPWLDGERETIEASDAAVLETLRIGPESRRRVDELLEQADALPISTFHAWCARFLTDHAPRLDLPPDLRIGNDDTVRQAFDADFLDFLRRETVSSVHPALSSFEPGELRELAWQLSALPEASWARAATTLQPPASTIEAGLQQLVADRARFAGAQKNWHAVAALTEAAYRDLLAGSAIADRSFAGKKPTGGKALGDDAEAAAQALAAHVEFLAPWLHDDEQLVQGALAFLTPFLVEQRRRRTERGDLTFDDLLLLTRRALLTDHELRRQAARGLRAILVDEFQDTDPLQYDVLFLLAGELDQDAAGDPYSLRLRPGVLCIVGDAKQSIYRFRRADITAFSRAVQHVVDQGGAALDLVANFRSLPPVLDVVNRVCAHSLAKDPPYQFDYVPVTATRTDGGDAGVEMLDLDEPELRAGERRQREGRAIVATIAGLRDAGIALSDVAVLLRAATDLSWLLRPLRKAGVPYVLEGSTRFYRRHEIVTATALIGAMARPHDAVAVLGVLRSAFSGADDAAIATFVRAGGSLDYRTPPAGAGAVEVCLRRLHDLWQRAAREPVDRALEHLLRRDELILSEGHGFEGAQRLANLERLLHKLLALGPLDLMQAADLLASHTDRETEDEESPLFDRETDAVRLLTVHRAKGLEFETVILPDLARSPHSPRGETGVHALRFFDANGHELIGVQVGSRRNAAACWIHNEEKRHREAEERRLFYVAATRARRRLVLLCNTGARALWQQDLERAALDDVPRQRIEELPELPARAVVAFDAAPTLAALRACEAVQRRAAAVVIAPSAPSRLGERRPARLTDIAASTVGRELGTAAHRYLAAVDLTRSGLDAELLAACGDAAWVDELAALLRRFADSALRRRLLAAERLHREWPIAYRTETGEINGSIDVLFEETGGVLTILDYKTDRIAARAHAKTARRYRAQLAAYAEGVAMALRPPRPPRCAVHFLRDDVTVEV